MRIRSTGGFVRGLLFAVAGLAASAGVAQANDVACNAEVIGALPYVPMAADAVNATDDLDTGCNASSQIMTRKGVWYRYDATSNTGLLVTETSGNDAAIAVFVGSDCNSLTQIHCNDDPDGIGFPVAAGQSYWILVGIYGAGVPTAPYALTFSELAAPANDTACAAQPITSGMNSIVDARTAGGDAPIAPCGTANSAFGTRHAIWYSFSTVSTGAGSLNVNETGGSTVVTQLFSGPDCNNLSLVTCTTTQNALFSLDAGTNYWISIGFNDLDNMPTATGQYNTTFTFIPPATNDDCETAIELSVAGGSVGAAAMTVANDPDVTCNSSSATSAVAGVWYHINLGLDSGSLVVTEAGSEDVVIVVYSGSCGSLSQVTCSDSETNIATALSANTDYYLMIARFGSTAPTAPYTFTYSVTGIQTGACCIGANCQILSAGSCATQNGIYFGANTLCGAGNPNATDSAISAIPDGTEATQVIGVLTRTLDVTDTGNISTIDIVAGLTHTWCGDLRLTLTSPSNTSAILVERPSTPACASPFTTNADNSNYGGTYRFSDSGTQTIQAAALLIGTDAAVASSTYQASACNGVATSLNSAFGGQPMNGTWTLTVEDLDGGDTGTLNGWGLVINGGSVIGCDTGPTPCEIADFNNSGSVTADDIFAFLDAWFAQNGSTGSGFTADVNDSDSVTADDIFAFLDLWFVWNGQTCP